MPGSQEIVRTLKSADGPITEHFVLSADRTTRVEVNDFLGSTLMRLTRAERPIDWIHESEKHCESSD